MQPDTPPALVPNSSTRPLCSPPSCTPQPRPTRSSSSGDRMVSWGDVNVYDMPPLNTLSPDLGLNPLPPRPPHHPPSSLPPHLDNRPPPEDTGFRLLCTLIAERRLRRQQRQEQQSRQQPRDQGRGREDVESGRQAEGGAGGGLGGETLGAAWCVRLVVCLLGCLGLLAGVSLLVRTSSTVSGGIFTAVGLAVVIMAFVVPRPLRRCPAPRDDEGASSNGESSPLPPPYPNLIASVFFVEDDSPPPSYTSTCPLLPEAAPVVSLAPSQDGACPPPSYTSTCPLLPEAVPVVSLAPSQDGACPPPPYDG